MEENSGKNTGIENLQPWKPGETGNPNGRPLGQRNYATIYREALIKLAKLNNKTPEELEEEILSKGLLNARGGNYAFYKDVLDRLHGTATTKTETKVEMTGSVDVKSKEAQAIAQKYEEEIKKTL
jgi:hypothetical protein